MAWEDTTSYSRGATRVPGEFRFRAPGCPQIIVHRHLDFPPDQWFYSCHTLRLERQALKNTDADAAKDEAFRAVHIHLRSLVAAMDKVLVAKKKPKAKPKSAKATLRALTRAMHHDSK